MEKVGLKVLVTGATGFIGSNLIDRLINDGHDVYALIRPKTTNGTKRLEKYKNINFIQSTPENLDKVKDLPVFDICFNLASYGVDYRQQNTEDMIDGNIKFILNIIDFCEKNKTKMLVHTGSCFEYGVNEAKPLKETDNLNPHSLYAASKVSSVFMANTYAKIKGVKMITIRPFGVYGANEGMHRLVPQLIDCVINNKKLDMTEGEQIRDYLFVNDLVDAYIKIATDYRANVYDIYNVCSSQEISIKKLVEKICDIYDYDISNFNFGNIPYRKNEVMYFVGDNSKIYNDIEWKPTTSLEDGLKLTIEWYKENLEEM